MPTPWDDEYVELVGASTTLLLGSGGIRLSEAADVMAVGPSRGQDRIAGGQDGRLLRTRVRDALPITLGLTIIGAYDEDGATVADPVANGIALLRKVMAWPDTEDRQFTLRLTQFTAVYEATAVFEEFGKITRPDDSLWRTSMLVTVPSGVLEVVP